ncbi:transposase [Empedobacter falsenii]
MKKSKFSEVQIIKIISEQDKGKTVLEICREYRINPSKYGFKNCYRKKTLTPDEKRELVDFSREEFKLSLRQACILFCISTSVFYYRPKRNNQDDLIIQELSSLADLNKTWGFW